LTAKKWWRRETKQKRPTERKRKRRTQKWKRTKRWKQVAMTPSKRQQMSLNANRLTERA
jgi:hypothetical protein